MNITPHRISLINYYKSNYRSLTVFLYTPPGSLIYCICLDFCTTEWTVTVNKCQKLWLRKLMNLCCSFCNFLFVFATSSINEWEMVEWKWVIERGGNITCCKLRLICSKIQSFHLPHITMGKSTFQWLHTFYAKPHSPFRTPSSCLPPAPNLKGIVKECGFFAPLLVELEKRGRGKPQSTWDFSRHRRLHFKWVSERDAYWGLGARSGSCVFRTTQLCTLKFWGLKGWSHKFGNYWNLLFKIAIGVNKMRSGRAQGIRRS